MRLNLEALGVLMSPELSASGGIVGGSVTVPDTDIVQSNLAITVQYVANKNTQYSGNQFTSGTIDPNRLPKFSGDLIKEIGTNYCSLVSLPLTPGNYAKVNVNFKGLITSGSGLNEFDIPNLPWSTINISRPTTLSGYGIVDALDNEGGNITGNFSIAISTDTDHLANKEMADNLPVEGYIKAGSIVIKATNQSVLYYLKCNGAEPLVNDYVSLYNVIGNTYTVKVAYGSGLPHLYQYEYNTTTTSSWSWTSSTSFPISINRAKSLVTKNKVYIIGGARYTNATSSLDRIYSADINSTTGVIGTWSLTSYLPMALDSFEIVVLANRLYLIGGSNLGSDRSTIYSTIIDQDGNLGVWEVIGDLPFILSSMSVVITRNLLTVIGGESGSTIRSTVIQAQIFADGSLGVWEYCPDLPSGRTKAAVFSTGNYVYLIGGQNIQGQAINTVLRSTIQDDGSLSSWTVLTSISLPDNTQDGIIFCTANRIHLFGGGTEKAIVTRNRIYTSTINADGTIGSWTVTTYPEQFRSSCIFLTSSRLYVLGGYRSNTSLLAVRYTSFTGGLNDYSQFYTADKRATDRGYFRLPNLLPLLQGTEFYIKT